MKKYILSKYTYIHKYLENYLIYNIVNGHFGNIFSRELVEILEKLLSGESVMETKLTRGLIANGFIVPNDVDEFSDIIRNYNYPLTIIRCI